MHELLSKYLNSGSVGGAKGVVKSLVTGVGVPWQD